MLFILIAIQSGLWACAGSSEDISEDTCSANSDCNTEGGEQCINGECKFPPTATAECTQDMDCPAGSYCDGTTLTCVSHIDGDVETEPFVCPERLVCISNRSCLVFGNNFACIDECCTDVGQPVETDGDETIPDGDGDPDIEQDTEIVEDCTAIGCPEHFACNLVSGECKPDETHCQSIGCEDRFACDDSTGLCAPDSIHCINDPCAEYFVCNETSGLCEPDVENCAIAGCPAKYSCNESNGLCEPSVEHCLNSGCQERFACTEETGECEPGPDHCDTLGCTNPFICTAETGLCDPGPNHCANSGCDSKWRCAPDTGDCMPADDHCAVQGCPLHYNCAPAGDCQASSTHCTQRACLYGYLCDSASGACKPSVSDQAACSGSSCDNASQYCINSGTWLCDCDSGLHPVDCEQQCFDEGYPSLDSCKYITNSSSPSQNRYDCDCGNYADSRGTCASPILVDRFPYLHNWMILGAQNTLHALGCDSIGTGTPGLGGYERVYVMDAVQGDRFRITVTATSLLFDVYVTLRNACGNDTDFCKYIQGTGFGYDETYTFDAPASGSYYISVESDNGLATFEIKLEKL
jgi:hypothetical protein